MIQLDWTLFVQIAIFLAFVAYLQTFLLGPMSRYMERRKKTVEDHHVAKKEFDESLAGLQKSYEQKINAAHEDLLSQRTAARKEALTIQNSLLDEAKEEAGEELASAEAELQKEIAAARERLARDLQSLASGIAGKVLGRRVS